MNSLLCLISLKRTQIRSLTARKWIPSPKRLNQSLEGNKRKKTRKRNNKFNRNNIAENPNQAYALFSPASVHKLMFSPETYSRNSVQSRIELEQVLREAQAFLDEPDIIYQPNNDIQIK